MMTFGGVFDRFLRLKVGSVEHELAWIPHWLDQMDFTYRERPTVTKGWSSNRPDDLSVGEGRTVLLATVKGSFYALEDVCGHHRMALSKGCLEGHEVECPLHFARFDVRTGALVTGPMSEDVLTYEVRVEGDTIYVKQEPNDV